MALIGFNGGLIGKRRKQDPTTSGLWFPNERAVIAGSDSYWNNVSLLLHMDGSNGSTTFTDSSNNALTVTANGNAQISTAQSKFGGASGLFDGTGDYLSTAHNAALSIESGDFTVESWIYRAVSGSVHSVINKRLDTPSSTGYAWRVNANNTLQFFFTGGSSITSTATVSSGAWTYIAATRSGNTVRQFIDGTIDATTATFSNGTSNTQEFRVGVDNLAGNGFNGYIDDFRITKGVARYTASFTAPTTPFFDA
jgi:hypothetical protein